MTSEAACFGVAMIIHTVIQVLKSGLEGTATGGSGGARTNTGGRIFCSGMGTRKALICGGRCFEDVRIYERKNRTWRYT